MKSIPPLIVALALVGISGTTIFAQEKKGAKNAATKDDDRLPHTKLMPAKLVPNLCVVKYRVSTSSSECQAFVDQALGYYYSYVWMEAARSFETALKHDPNCAFAWWGLSKASEKWGKAAYAPPLKKAQELMPQANERESRLIKARLQEKGLIDTVKQEDRKKEAVKTLDELLALYDDDEERAGSPRMTWLRRGRGRRPRVLQGALAAQSAASGRAS